MVETLTLQELAKLESSDFYLIDIRTTQEFAQYHLPNAINIPYDLLMTYHDNYLKKDQNYYLVCGHGSLSYRACAILQSYGYNVKSISDGYNLRHYCP